MWTLKRYASRNQLNWFPSKDEQASIPVAALRVSSTEFKVRNTSYSIINSITGKYCSVAFI